MSKPDGTELFERLDAVKGISLSRLRELASAEREGRVVVLNEIFKTPTWQYGFIYYDKQGLMTGDFRDTKAESEAARALAATEPKGGAT